MAVGAEVGAPISDSYALNRGATNRTESARQQAEYAIQAVKKVAATLEANTQYYPKPFASRGIVLLFDNSDLSL